MARANNIPICDYEGSPWRTEFWPGREYEDRAERIALNHLLPPTGKRLIEIGAGFGRLADLYRGYDQVVLLDYARSMLQDAHAHLGSDPRFIFVAADLYNMPFVDNAFDVAVTVRVLHHVADIPCAFDEISRLLRPHGTYVTDFANKRHLKAVLRYWLGRISNGAPDHKVESTNPFSLAPYEFVKLNFDYHPSYISQNLSRARFEVHEQRAVSTFRLGFLKRLVPATLLASLDGFIQRPTARLQLSPSLFLCAESAKRGAPQINSTLWRCVRCGSAGLELDPTGLCCPTCATIYPCIDGIYDLKLNQ